MRGRPPRTPSPALTQRLKQTEISLGLSHRQMALRLKLKPSTYIISLNRGSYSEAMRAKIEIGLAAIASLDSAPASRSHPPDIGSEIISLLRKIEELVKLNVPASKR